MGVTRTFVAVEVSERVRSRAAALTDRLACSNARVNWVTPANMHITLKFLGDQTDQQLATVCKAVQDATSDVPAFQFECHGAGAFPTTDRPRTIWMGVRDGLDGFQRLHAAVDQQLADIGVVPDRRAFRPHLTIGRVRSGGPAQNELGQLVERNREFQGAGTEAREVIVFASQLERSGPTYHVVARAALQD